MGVPGREVFEALCAAVEPLRTAERQPWKVQNASLRQGQVETPLGLKDAGMALLSTHSLLEHMAMAQPFGHVVQLSCCFKTKLCRVTFHVSASVTSDTDAPCAADSLLVSFSLPSCVAVGPKVEVQCITLGEADGTAHFLQREQRRVMQADQAMMDILSKVMPYKVSTSYSKTLRSCLH